MTKKEIKQLIKEEEELWSEVDAGRADKHIVSRILEINLLL